MSASENRRGREEPGVERLDGHRRTRDEHRTLAREALVRATTGPEPDVSPLIDAVPAMVEEARRRRASHARRDALTASIPLARRAIPRLAAAAGLLVAVSAVMLLTGTTTESAATESLEELLLGGNGITEERMIESILGTE